MLKARAILSRPSGAQILPACPTVPIGNAVLTYTLEAAPFQHGAKSEFFSSLSDEDSGLTFRPTEQLHVQAVSVLYLHRRYIDAAYDIGKIQLITITEPCTLIKSSVERGLQA